MNSLMELVGKKLEIVALSHRDVQDQAKLALIALGAKADRLSWAKIFEHGEVVRETVVDLDSQRGYVFQLRWQTDVFGNPTHAQWVAEPFGRH
jgi:hypothetical protein